MSRLTAIDREEAKAEEDFSFSADYDDPEDWENDAEEPSGNVKDESAAYLEFLNEEVSILRLSSHSKFS